jgi:peptidylprolyl isomerase
MARRGTVLLLCALALTAAGCGGSPRSAGLPVVHGGYGQKPTLSFPAQAPGHALQKKILRQGSGPVVAKGDLLIADYLGQIWRGKVFDSSFDRGQPAAFAIGRNAVVPGVDKGLVGVKAGSRVLLVIPPVDGYGPQGFSQAGIKGTDTLVFVVDVISEFGRNATGDPNAMPLPAQGGGPEVSGLLGQPPTIQVPKKTPPPKKPTAVLLARGTGNALQPGLLVMQDEVTDWSGKVLHSTWQTGTPDGADAGIPSQPSPLDALIGLPIGSRVLLTWPPQDAKTAATASNAAVIDIIAQPLSGKNPAAG